MLIKEKAKIIRSEVKCPDILNGLALVMHFLKG
jgi:hypothetical protein